MKDHDSHQHLNSFLLGKLAKQENLYNKAAVEGICNMRDHVLLRQQYQNTLSRPVGFQFHRLSILFHLKLPRSYPK